ncbi:MAG TPA: RsmB/NOP family class I SAM-dependent RNA methyltransferase [Aestuariivirga sp.]
MKQAGRIAAAIEIITEIFTRNRPASEALRDWGKAHRFAGSTDRHVIGTLVYDCLRNKNYAAAQARSDAPRGLVLGTLVNVWKLSADEIDALCAEQFGAGALSTAESKALSAPLTALADHIAGNFPQWLTPQLSAAFGPNLVAEMQALAQRAPIDLRVNTLKATREQVLESLVKFNAVATPLSPTGIRIQAPGIEGKNINVEAEPAHGMGQFEVQDEASQLAALIAAPKPGQQVLDLCAGAGGKSLALAALMQNKGLLVAHDRDKHRLRPIFERITRSGASCIEVIAADEQQKLARQGGYDLVVVDAPCTGSGTWRRKPDAKWRLGEKQLQVRLNEQAAVLSQAAPLVKKGGKLVYFTCSILPIENIQQLQKFLKAHSTFKLVPYMQQWSGAPASVGGSTDTLQLTPYQHNTDGFFMGVMERV